MRLAALLMVLGLVGCSGSDGAGNANPNGTGGSSGTGGSPTTGGTGGTAGAGGTPNSGGTGGTEAATAGAGGNGGSSLAGTGGMAASGGDAGSTAGTGGEGALPNLPITVGIELLGALIGPGKSDGTQWDGTDTVPPEVLELVATAAGVPGAGALLGVVQDAAYQALSKPDPFGVAELNWDGTQFDPDLDLVLADIETNDDDTFQPLWPSPTPSWSDVPFDPGVQVRVTLHDEDLTDHDAIGIATINYDDLVEAWLAQDSHWIRVDDQTQGQLFALQVQVIGVVE